MCTYIYIIYGSDFRLLWIEGQLYICQWYNNLNFVIGIQCTTMFVYPCQVPDRFDFIVFSAIEAYCLDSPLNPVDYPKSQSELASFNFEITDIEK